MKNFLPNPIVLLFLCLAIASCKKEETPTPTPAADPADSYVGIWSAKDTMTYPGDPPLFSQYNFTVSKKDANTVYFLKFSAADTIVMSVSNTAVALVAVYGFLSQSGYYSNFSGTRTSNAISYTYNDAVTNTIIEGRAIKQ